MYIYLREGEVAQEIGATRARGTEPAEEMPNESGQRVCGVQCELGQVA